MRSHNYLAFTLTALACLFLSMACSENDSQPQEIIPSTEFSTYVKAYTGNGITADTPIIIEFTSTPTSLLTSDILKISPSVRGEVRWTSDKTLSFIPKEGEMKSGTLYTVSCDMQKLYNISDNKFKTFRFTFRTAEKAAKLEVGAVKISANTPDKASVSGQMIFSEAVEQSLACKMIKVDYPHPGTKIIVEDKVEKAKEFKFSIENLTLSNEDSQLEINFDGNCGGFASKLNEKITIPSDQEFKVISASLIPDKNEYIQICFTRPIAAMDDYTGLIMVLGAGRQICEIKDNIANIYFERFDEGEIYLNISSYLKSSTGQNLDKEYAISLAENSIKPAVELLLEGNIIPDINSFTLPFKAINLSAVDIRVIKVFENNVLMFLQENDLYEDSNLRRSGRVVYKSTMMLNTEGKDLQKWQNFSLDLSGLFKDDPGAIYRVRLSFQKDYSLYGKDKSEISNIHMIGANQNQLNEDDEIVWDTPQPYYYDYSHYGEYYDWYERDDPTKPSYYMENDRFPEVNLISSNIGIVAKAADIDKIWVNVNDIISTTPISDAEVTAYNYQLQIIGKGKTDSQGAVQLNLSGKPFIIVASKGKSKTYLKVTDGYENPLDKFDVGGKILEKGIKSYIYGDRGVWRPGDTIHLTAIVEDPDKTLPANHPASIEIYTPQGQFYAKQICPLGKDGFYRFDIQTDSDDPTGRWNAYIKVGGVTLHKALAIETIKPNRLKVNLDINDEVLTKNSTTTMELSASWLTGPVAAGLKATGEMNLRIQDGTFKGFEGYLFRNMSSNFSSESYTIFKTTLDDNGKSAMTVEMPSGKNAPGMLSADIITKVQEPGGDFSIVSQTIPFSPFDAYVGIKAPKTEGYYETDKDHIFKIATVDKNGKRVSGHTIEYHIYELSWNWWWEYGKHSYDSYINSSNAKVVSQGRFTSGKTDNQIVFNLKYPEWGRYYIHVKDLDSGHICGKEFLVDWPSWRGRADRGNPDGVSMLTFTTDKKEYEVGEKCTVYIPAASEGRTLVSIENGRRVISRNWVKTSAKQETPYTFTISKDMAPNFYIHLTLLQPYKNTINDLPIRMYGVQSVTVTNKASVLKPVISMPDVIRPQEKFNVTVSEKTGREMTYTIAIVDEGLLDITNFKTPDPWKRMYEKEALGVKTWDMYDNITGVLTGRLGITPRVGGDEYVIVKEKKEDNRFKPVVKFLGPFTTKGKATHSITLPMYVGSVRVMVVAGKDRAYGNAEKTVPVRSPLMILPTLPRILGTDEVISVPVNVFAMEKNIKNVNVSIYVDGPAEITSSSKKSLEFNQTGDKITRFEMKTKGEGTLKVTVKAAGSGHSVEETITLEVRNPSTRRLDTEMRVIQAGKAATFEWSPECEWAKFEASVLPSIDYNGLFTYTTEYNHYCTEQICSRGISLLYSMDKFNEENKILASETIEKLLKQLYSRQMNDGGFRYWPGTSTLEPWCSTMAGHFMIAAQQRGYQVDNGVYNRWKRYQRNAIRSFNANKNDNQDIIDQAYGLYTLALAGIPENGAMNRMKESNISLPQARWLLSSAYAFCGKQIISKEILYNTGVYKDNSHKYNFSYGSDGRDKAMALEAAVLCGNITDAMKLAEEVAEDIDLSGYTTQTAAFASVALERLSKIISSKAIDIEVSQQDVQHIRSVKSSVGFDVDKNLCKAKIRNSSDEPVYITMAAYGQRGGEAEMSGLALSVVYKDNTGRVINHRDLRQGTEFTAEIKVSNTKSVSDYSDMALTMTLPSGWEIFNTRLYGIDEATILNYTYNDIRDDRSCWYFDLKAGQSKTFSLRLIATYEGVFSLPSVCAEAMYDNSVHAYTAAESVKVSR